MISKLPSGRWRAQVYDPRKHKNISVSQILGPDFKSFPTKREAKQAQARAEQKLAAIRGQGATLKGFADRWTTDRLFLRPKASTNLVNAEAIRAFVDQYGHLSMSAIDDLVVAEWLADGGKGYQVRALRAMFSDAMSVKGGRLIDRNPFAKLGVGFGKGNRGKNPPNEAVVRRMFDAAYVSAGPGFAGWMKVACGTGMRPAEVDALRLENVNLERGRIRVVEQYSAKAKAFTLPKNGLKREALITPMARESLIEVDPSATFCFTNSRGNHWMAPSRAHHWKAVKVATGFKGSLYLATRHFAGWYMTNILELASEDVAIALGHTDGGELVRKLYGHRETARALDRVAQAYESAAMVRPLRLVREA